MDPVSFQKGNTKLFLREPQGGYEPSAYVYFDRPAPFRNEQAIILAGADVLLAKLDLLSS